MNISDLLIKHIETCFENEPGKSLEIHARYPIGGGDINEAWLLESKSGNYFLKLNSSERLAMFETEAHALEIIHTSKAIRSPKPIVWGSFENTSWFLMEYLDLNGNDDCAALGKQLAQLHRQTAEEFGWNENNFIGRTTQINSSSDNWCDFWVQNRLQVQLTLAYENGFKSQLAKVESKLIDVTSSLLEPHKPQASLLHGDLWGGNKGWLRSGEPVIFDPASYYGDRETDIAMTELFGGFGQDFYQAYNTAWPLGPGYEQRKVVYNLYHMLNHLNLFGDGYLKSCIRMANKIINI